MLLQKKYLWLVILCLVGHRGFGQTVINLTSSSVASSTVCRGATDVSIYTFNLDGVGGGGTNNLSGVNFIQGGTAIDGPDVIQYKLWSGSIGGTLVTTNTTPAFTFPDIAFNNGTNIDFFITADIAGTATDGQTITVTAMNNGNLTVSETATNGATTAGGTQTISVPTVASITANPTSLCVGSNITFTAGAATGPGAPTYNWTGPNGYNVSGAGSTSVLTASVTAASGVYSLSVTYPGAGCTSAQVTSTPVTVNALPTVTSINPSSTNLCIGVNLTLTAVGATGTGTPSFAWTGPNGYSVTTGIPSAVLTTSVTAASGIYSVTVTYPGTGCTSNTVQTSFITVNALPTVASLAASPNPLCVNDLLTLSAGAVTGTGSPTYNWSGPNGFNTAGAASITTLTASSVAASGVYSLTVTYPGAGCTSTRVTSTSVTVNPLPAIISEATPDINVCVNSVVTLHDATAGGAWSSGNSSVATIGSGDGVVTASASPGTTTITYTLLTTGCATTANIIVNNAPTPIGGTLVVCTGAITTLNATPAGGSWSSSSIFVAQVGTSSGIVTGNAPGTVTITYTLGTGCSVTALLTVNTSPSGITGTQTVCSGVTTTLNATPTGGTWNSISTGVATIDPSTGVVSGVSGGTSTISYILSSSCFSIATVTVFALPSITLTTNPTPANVCATADITYSASSASAPLPSGPFRWTVDPGFSLVSGGFGLSDFTATAKWGTSGLKNVSIQYVDINGCFSPTVTITTTVNAAPVFTVTGTPNPICTGTTLTLDKIGSSGTYSWAGPNLLTTTGTPITTVPTVSATYSLTVTDGSGCTGTASITVTVNAQPQPITGGTTFNVCKFNSENGVLTLTDPIAGGTWHSSNPAIGSVDAGGNVTGITVGTTLISYTLAGVGGNCSTFPVTVNVNPSPDVIGVPGTVCEGTPGTTMTLTNSVVGGTWTSSNPVQATIGSSSGLVTGLVSSTPNITYSLPNGSGPGSCIATKIITVNPLPTPVTADSVCEGLTKILTALSPGGTWSTSSSTIASIVTTGPTTGLVSGISVGTETITYTLPTACKTTTTIRVDQLPNVISPDSVCAGLFVKLHALPVGGSWSNSPSTPFATVVAASAGTEDTSIVTGGASLVQNIDTVVYTLSTGCLRKTSVTVNPLPLPITGSDSVCSSLSSVGLIYSTTLTGSPAGGTWKVENDSTSITGGGVLTALRAGVDTITYTLPTTCKITKQITINQTPVVAPTVLSKDSICSGSSLNIPLSSATLADFTWTVVPDSFDANGGGPGNAITEQLNGNNLVGKNVTYFVTPKSTIGACIGPVHPISVHIRPTPLKPGIFIDSTLAYNTPSSRLEVCANKHFHNFGAGRSEFNSTEIFEWSATYDGVLQLAGANTRKFSLISFPENPVTNTDIVTLTTYIQGYKSCKVEDFDTVTLQGKADNYTVYYYNNRFVCQQNVLKDKVSYKWGYDQRNNLQGAFIPDETNQDYYNPAPQFNSLFYWVMTTTKDGCTQKTYFQSPTGLTSTTPSLTTLRVYPNPVSAILNIELTGNNSNNTDVEIFDIVGRRVHTATISGDNGTVPVADIAPGAYFVVCIQNGLKIGTSKFIKN